MSRTSLAWIPALAVPALIAVAVVAVPMQAGASVDLPDKSADEVLQLIAESTEDSFSGTVQTSADLGLPTLPDQMGGGAPNAEAGLVGEALDLLSGTQEARVWVDGPLNQRVQVQDSLAERRIVSNGTDAWFYDSETNVATHVAIPEDARSAVQDKIDASGTAPTPAELADRILAELGPSTEFAVGTDTTVAGRTVYDLVLTPRAAGTLTESVAIAVDSETGLPLRIWVAATGQNEPAFEIGFTAIDFGDPAADPFTFTPGDGVTVDEGTLPGAPDQTSRGTPDPAEHPVVTGSGWDAIVTIPAASVPAELAADPLFAQLTTQVDGGRALSTALVTVLFADDGRILAGSVPVERLQAEAQ